jgi:hypothetical protein
MGQELWRVGARVKFTDKEGLVWTAEITAYDEKNGKIYFTDLKGKPRMVDIADVAKAHVLGGDDERKN